MKPNELTPRYEALLRCFTHLPQQILSLHKIDNATEYVLHSLCDAGCLDLQKAAYLVDNPDFDCLQGVAGFNKAEEVHTCEKVLDDELWEAIKGGDFTGFSIGAYTRRVEIETEEDVA